MPHVSTPARRLTTAVAVVVVVAVLGIVVGAMSAVLRGPTFTSESQLLWDPSIRSTIDPSYSAPDSQAFDRQVADQQDVVLSDAVVGRVARAVDEAAETLRDRITVTSTAGSAAFTIAASAPTAVEARAIAQATTTAYVAVLRARNEQQLQDRVDALTAQVAALRQQASGGSATQNAVAGALATLQTQQAAASAALQAVPVEAQVQRVAETPTSPSSLSVPVQAVVGGGLGALLAICALLLLNALRPSSAARPSHDLSRPGVLVPPVPGLSRPVQREAAEAVTGQTTDRVASAVAKTDGGDPGTATAPDEDHEAEAEPAVAHEEQGVAERQPDRPVHAE